MNGNRCIRRVFAFLLAFAMLTSCISMGVFADEEQSAESEAATQSVQTEESELPHEAEMLGITEEEWFGDQETGSGEESAELSETGSETIIPVADTYIRSQGSSTNESADNSKNGSNTTWYEVTSNTEDGDAYDLSNNRGVSFYTFDISELNAAGRTVTSAELILNERNNARDNLIISYVDDTDDGETVLYNWQEGMGNGHEDNLSWSTFMQDAQKRIANYWNADIGPLNRNQANSFDVTRAVQAMQAMGNNKLTLFAYALQDSRTNASEIYSITNGDDTLVPQLVVTYDDANPDLDTAIAAAKAVDDGMYAISQDPNVAAPAKDADGNDIDGVYLSNRISLKSSVTLPTYDGATITWTSTNESLANDGTVTQPSYIEGASYGELTATITVGGTTLTRTYNTKVTTLEATENEFLELAAREFESRFGYTEVYQDFELPKSYNINGSTITATYTSNDEAISIDNNAEGDYAHATVVRPEADEDAEVTVTATLRDQNGNVMSRPVFIYVYAMRTTYTIPVEADTYIRSSVAGENNDKNSMVAGMNSVFNADGDVTSIDGARGIAVMRFDLSQLAGTVSSAQVNAYMYSGGVRTVAYAVLDDEDPNNLIYTWNDTGSNPEMTWNSLTAALDKPIIQYPVLATGEIRTGSISGDITQGLQKAQAEGHTSVTVVIYEAADSDGANASNIYAKETAMSDEYIPTLTVSTVKSGEDETYKELIATSMEIDETMAGLNQNAYSAENPSGLNNRILLSTQEDRGDGYITLPIYIGDNIEIEWSSSDDEVINISEMGEDGRAAITPNSYLEGDALVTLTARIRNDNNERVIKRYNIKVEREPAEADEILSVAAENLREMYDQKSQTTDFTFINEIDAGGQTVTIGNFVSSDETHLSVGNVTGETQITRPTAEESTAQVTVTVTLTYGGTTMEVPLTIYVPKISSEMTDNIRDDLGKIIEKAEEALGVKVESNVDGNVVENYYTNYYIKDENIVVKGEVTEPSVQNVPDANTLAYYDDSSEDTAAAALWGQIPKSAWDKFKATVDEAKVLYANQDASYAQMYNMCTDLIYGGEDMILTAKLSDDIDEETRTQDPLAQTLQNYKVRFSEYRRLLNALVYRAETTLLWEPYFHYNSDKETLQHAIDEAKASLEYNHEVGFIRGRYMHATQDIDISREIKHFNMYETEDVVNGMSAGLYATIDWYTSYHILADAYNVDKMKTTDETYLQSGRSASAATSGATLTVGGGRAAVLLKYDLGEEYKELLEARDGDKVITNIKLGFQKYHSGATDIITYYLADDVLPDWSESNTDYDSVSSNPDTAALVSTDRDQILALDGTQEIIWDLLPSGNVAYPAKPTQFVYDAYGYAKDAIKEHDGSNTNMTFMIGHDTSDYMASARVNHNTNGSDMYSRRAGHEYYPYLQVTTNETTYESLREKYDFIISLYDKFIKKFASADGSDPTGNVGTDAGNYRPEDYDAVMAAKAAADAAIEVGDQNEVGLTLVALLDAMRDASNNQYKRNLIDPDSTLYFTPEEKLEMQQKVEQIPELRSYYESQIANNDAKSLDMYQWGYALFMNEKITTANGTTYDYTYGRDQKWYDDLVEFMNASGAGNGFETFSTGRRAVNSKPGAGVAYVSYEIELPSDINEADAQARVAEETAKYGQDEATPNWIGHVWVDTASLLNANSEQILTFDNERTEYGSDNLGFELWETKPGDDYETPVGWETIDSEGNTVHLNSNLVGREQRTGYKNAGNYSVKITNQTSDDNVILRYTDPTRGDDSNSNIKNYMFAINKDSNGNAVPLTGSASLTVNSMVKQEGYLNGFNGNPITADNGVIYRIRYYDIDGNEISGGSQHYFNFRYSANQRPSWGDAFYYMITGDTVSAQKVKYGLLTFASDFLESVEVNEQTNMECNARGEVQLGRQLSVMLSMYSVIEDADVFTDYEMEQFEVMVERLVDYCVSRRDNSVYKDEQVMNSNWYTDMFLGSACTALAFREEDPDNPGMMQSKIFHANEIIDGAEWQQKVNLENNISNSGAYSESLRYMWAAYSRVASSSKFYSNCMNDNWFINTKLPLIFEFGVQTQTAPYTYTNGNVSSPTHGDTNITEGAQGMAMLAQYAPEVEEVNPTLAAMMLSTWERAGSPVRCDTEGVPLTVFFLPLDTSNRNNIPFTLTSTDYYHEYSPIMYRNNPGRNNETLAVGISATRDMAHGHEDQGSFTLFKNGAFLVVDTSVENYWDTSSKGIYLSSSNHACFTFYSTSASEPIREINLDNNANNMSNHIQTVDVASASGVSDLIYSSFNDSVDKTVTKIEVQGAGGGGEHYRHFAMLKNGMDSIVIWDQVKDNSSYTQFNLPVAAYETQVDQANRKATSIGYYNYNVETNFLYPEDTSIVYDRMRAANVVPQLPDMDYPYQEVLRSISAERGQSQLNVVTPVQKGENGITTEKIDVGDEDILAYKLTAANGASSVIVINQGTRAKTVNLGMGTLYNEETYEVFDGNVPRETMLVLTQDELSRPNSIQISGDSSIRKPATTGTLTYNYQAQLLDQYNNTMTGIHNSENNGMTNPAYDLELANYEVPGGDYYENYIASGSRPDYVDDDVVFNSKHPELVGYPKITWSLEGNPRGASIDPDTGILSVTSELGASTLTINATSNGVTNSYRVQVGGSVAPTATTVEVNGPTRLGLTYGESFSTQYSYTVYDQFGQVMTNVSDINFSVNSSISGVSIDRNGAFTMTADAVNQILGSEQTGGLSFSVSATSRSNSYLVGTLGVYANKLQPTSVQININGTIQIRPDEDNMIPIDIDLVDQNGGIVDTTGATIEANVMVAEGELTSISVVNQNNQWYIRVPGGINLDDEPEVGIEVVVTTAEGDRFSTETPLSLTTDQIASSLEISGESSVTAADNDRTYNYTAKVYDRFGDEMDDGLKWTVSKLAAGTSFNVNTGVLTVSSTARTGEVIVRATSDSGLTNTMTVAVSGTSGETSTDIPSGGGGSTGGGSTGGGTITGGGGLMGGGTGGIGGTGTPTATPTPGTETGGQRFADVPESYWGYEFIESLAAEGLVQGAGDGNFYPENNVTRAEFVQMIVNMTGDAMPESSASFSDVATDDWYYEAVSIGSAAGYITGYPEGDFRPDDLISRQDMAVIIDRVVTAKGIEFTVGEMISFSDEAEIADYAKDAVTRAQQYGIINGYEDGTFKPNNNAVRSEAAKIIYVVNEGLK